MSTTAPSVDLPVARLGRIGPKIGAGGQAVVYELPALTLPDVQGPLVYKRYKPGRAPQHGLAKVVGLRTRLLADLAVATRLDAATAWPVRQVVDPGGAVLGLVLPRIPPAFFHDIRLPSGRVRRSPREVQFLFIPPDRALRGGTATPTPVERLTICRDFAETLAFLHRDLDVAFGDINARNAVFRLDARPTVMFVDCDAVRLRGHMPSVPQLNAPDWDPPEGADVLSQSTDRYKLGLFVLRCLTPADKSSINRDPAWARGALDAEGLTLLDAAIRGPYDRRPTAEQWFGYLRRALGEALDPPRLVRVDLDRGVVAAGEPVTLSWSAEDADTVELTGVGIEPISVRGSAGSGTIVLYPTRTGPITVAVRNPLGTDSARTGSVAVFDVAAAFQNLPVPMPQLAVPRFAPPDLPAIGSALPPFPAGFVVPSAPMVDAAGRWPESAEHPVARAIAAVPPPPLFGHGPSAAPVDITTIMSGAPDPEPDPKVHP